MREIHSTQCKEGVHIVSTAAMVLASKVFRVIPMNNTRIIPIPVGGINRNMIGRGRRYLRAKAEISASKDGDIYSANGFPIFTDVIVDRTNHDGKNPCDV